MRLTLHIIGEAEQLCGPNKERIVSLRGLKIPAIENLGATGDLFDVIDLCSNSLIRLDNFPPLNRLETLLLANNCVTKLDRDLLHSLRRLKSLILTSNRLSAISDLVPLTKGKSLERLSLVDNPVTGKQNYRHYLIYRIPTLRFLDFSRVTDTERLSAKQLFSGPAGAALLQDIEGDIETATATAGPATVLDSTAPIPVNQSITSKLTETEVAMIKDAIARAPTLAEIQRLEEALKCGVLPDNMMDADM